MSNRSHSYCNPVELDLAIRRATYGVQGSHNTSIQAILKYAGKCFGPAKTINFTRGKKVITKMIEANWVRDIIKPRGELTEHQIIVVDKPKFKDDLLTDANNIQKMVTLRDAFSLDFTRISNIG